MTGIQYVTDENGKRLAVQIDLEKYARLWQDFENSVHIHEQRSDLEREQYSFENALKFWKNHRVDLSHFVFNRDEANER